MARTATAALAVVVGMAALLAGCTVGPSQRPPVAVRGENMPVLPTPDIPALPAPPGLPQPQGQNPAIRFHDCTATSLGTLTAPPDRALRVDCGEITLAADIDRIDLGGVTLDVIEVAAADAPDTRPPLLVIGDSAGEASARAALVLATRVDPAVLDRYTLVGLDRRGTGSDRLSCASPEARAAIVDGTGGDPASLDGLLEQARSIVQDCSRLPAEVLGTVTTAATTVDVDQLRASLGVERLSAIGYGDGATALADWARAAPDAVGTLVLDGPPAPDAVEPQLSETRAAAAEAAFDAFAVACTGRPDCPLGPDPRAAVTDLLRRLTEAPSTAVDGRRLTAGGVVTALLDGLAEPRDWPALGSALAAARTGEPTPLLDTLVPLTGPGGRFDARLATTCNDHLTRLAPGEIGDLTSRWRESHPLFGATLALRLLACAPWPTGGTPATRGTADGAPPILVLGTANDPRGPIDGSRRTAESLASARFVTWQGSGSGAYPRTPCVATAVDAALLDGVTPEDDVLCPP